MFHNTSFQMLFGPKNVVWPDVSTQERRFRCRLDILEVFSWCLDTQSYVAWPDVSTHKMSFQLSLYNFIALCSFMQHYVLVALCSDMQHYAAICNIMHLYADQSSMSANGHKRSSWWRMPDSSPADPNLDLARTACQRDKSIESTALWYFNISYRHIFARLV